MALIVRATQLQIQFLPLSDTHICKRRKRWFKSTQKASNFKQKMKNSQNTVEI
jgi:hypothetical protein